MNFSLGKVVCAINKTLTARSHTQIAAAAKAALSERTVRRIDIGSLTTEVTAKRYCLINGAHYYKPAAGTGGNTSHGGPILIGGPLVMIGG
ncbi:MAG: hypothetical protein ABGY43_06105 [bacterium]|jgi:hypothetical protein|nr:hypothetical protein [Gammaproteobacteria bacterium]HIL82602.1 hypothetical protein [Pseudomonadales bacterium]